MTSESGSLSVGSIVRQESKTNPLASRASHHPVVSRQSVQLAQEEQHGKME